MKRESFFAGLAVFLLRALFATLRLKVIDRSGFATRNVKSPVIFCFWHNRILAITFGFTHLYQPKRLGVTVLTSPSKDGEILAKVAGGFGMNAVRGSSSRRGSQALRELIALIENHHDVAVTPDGPRGPRYRLGPGAISLAQLTDAAIIPIHASFSRCLRLKTWDQFIIPLPFSTISLTMDETISVPRDLSPEEFEAIRLRVETLLKNEAD